jgi:glucose-6-phosphate dehydrogenase assembly protein OpcA
MASTTDTLSAEEFLSGKITSVDVPGIERELRALWASAREAHPIPQNASPDVVRACTLNFIFFSREKGAELSCGNVLDEIAAMHPCRALLAISLGGEEPKIEAWVSARCHMVPGSTTGPTKQICCEQITVRSEGPGIHKLSSAVIPLLLPDLPTFIYWRCHELDQLQIDSFKSACDKIIIDSQSLSANLSSFAEVGELIKTNSKHLVVSDLNWRRIHAWRRMIALQFSQTVLNSSGPQQIAKIKIQHYGGMSQAILFLAWMSSLLGWHVTSVRKDEQSGPDTNLHLKFNDQIEVEIIASLQGYVPAGNISAVEITMQNGYTLSALYEPESESPSLVAELKNNGQHLHSTVTQGPCLSETNLVGLELETLVCDQIYGKAIAAACQIVSQITK